jgi:hypothetical protein
MKACPTCAATYANDVAFCPRDGAALRSTAGLEPGAVIRKKYEIISEIGRGGMGVVYRARHLIWNEEKALKVLIAEGGGAQQGLKGLLAEALVMRQLQHPHIVRVEDADYTEDDQPFVVMEYVAGQNVRERLQSSGTLAPEVALRIAADTCSALSAAHQKGIVHRDIKPQNLLLARGSDGSESVKVIDFGIAKVREDAGLGFTGIMTGTTGYFVCTPAYASPEQAQGMRGADLDGRSDVYSLGLVLYEMLTGSLPFAAENPQALLWQRLQVQPMPLDRARPGLTFSPDVSGLVMKALERDREDRWRSAEEMERAIARVLDSRRAEREIAEAARQAEEYRRREKVEKTRLAAEGAKRERQERERAQAAKAAAERTDREREQREEAKLEAEREQAQCGQERLALDDAERKKQKQPALHPLRRDYGGATRMRGARRPWQRTYGIAGLALGLAVAGFFVARHMAEKPAPDVGRQSAEGASTNGDRSPPPTPLSETANGRAAIPTPATENAGEPRVNGGATHASKVSTPGEGARENGIAMPAPPGPKSPEKPVAQKESALAPKSAKPAPVTPGVANNPEAAPKTDASASASSAQGGNLKALSQELDEARQKFEDVKTHYGANHPEYRKAAARLEATNRQLQQAAAPASVQNINPAVTLHVSVTADADTWVQVWVDGNSVMAGMLQPNAVKTFAAVDALRIRTGNAGSLQVTVNGKPAGPLGLKGQLGVVEVTRDGVHILPPPPKPAPAPL